MYRFLRFFLCLLIISSAVVFAEGDEDALFEDEAFFKVEEQIVVSGSKRAQKLSDAPVAISVIRGEDLKNLGVQSIAEALRFVPGVYVQETTGGHQDVAIRGMINGPKEAGTFGVYSRNILVMIDGRSYFNDIFGGTFWEFLPITMDDIDRIEVVRGPSSALFGANAVTGVVNIITKNFKKTEGAHLMVSTGDNGQNLHTFRFGKAGEKVSFRIGAEYSSKDILDDKTYNHSYDKYISKRASLLSDAANGFPENPDFPAVDEDALNLYRISAFLNFKLTENNNINLQLGRSSGSANLPGTSGDLLLVGYDEIENNVIKLTYQWKDLKVSLSKIFGGFGEEFAGDAQGSDGMEQDGMNWNSIDLDAQYVFEFGEKDILVTGVNWRKAQSEGGDVYFRDRIEKEQKFKAAFFNNEYKISEKLKWILGARYDKYDTPDKDKWSPQSILFYRPSDKNTFRLIYSQAIRAPFIADLFTNAQFSAGTIVNPGDPDYGDLAPIITLLPNEQLEPMTIKSIELGYSTLLQEKINLDLNIYHYVANNLIAYENTQNDSLIFNIDHFEGTAIPWTKDNCSAVNLRSVNLDGKLKSDGLELGLNYNVNKAWRVWGNYSYQNSTFQGKHTNAVPSHLASVGSVKHYDNGLSVTFALNYISSSEVTMTNIMDQTLAQINKDLANDLKGFVTEAKTGVDPYKEQYLTDGGYIYSVLAAANGITLLNDTTFASTIAGIGPGGAGYIDAATVSLLETLWGSLNSPEQFCYLMGLDTSTAALFTASDNTLASAAARGVNGELYKTSSKKSSSQKVGSHLFINFRLAKKVLDGNGEVALIGSIRPDRRQYAYGEETGNKFRASFTYKF